MDHNLKVGDILYDIESKQVGILLERSNQHPHTDLGDTYVVWAWKIHWSNGACFYYSEEGLVLIVKAMTFLHFRSD